MLEEHWRSTQAARTPLHLLPVFCPRRYCVARKRGDRRLLNPPCRRLADWQAGRQAGLTVVGKDDAELQHQGKRIDTTTEVGCLG